MSATSSSGSFLTSLPLDVVAEIVGAVTSGEDLTTLARVCRLLNWATIPLIYRHTVLTIENPRCATKLEVAPRWITALRGLALNSQDQCCRIRKLTVHSHEKLEERGSFPLRYTPGGDNDSDNVYALAVNRHSRKVDSSDTFDYLATSLFEIAISRMSRIDALHWAADICPTNMMLRSLSRRKLNSFSYRWNAAHLLGLSAEWPSSLNPDVSILDFSSLESLSIHDIGTTIGTNLIADLLPMCRQKLRVVKLGYAYREWSPQIPGLDLDTLARHGIDPSSDSLLPLIHKMIPLDEPLRLHTLEISRCSNTNYKTWSKVFNFEGIQDLCLMNFYNLFNLRVLDSHDAYSGIWADLQRTGAQFRSLKTDSFSPEFCNFMRNSHGLESLLMTCPCCVMSEARLELDISGNFSSLRQLFLPKCSVKSLKTIVSSCPLLEELAISIPTQEKEETWRILNDSRLKSLYCLDFLYHGHSGRYLRDREFIRDFCNYFGHDSPSLPGLWSSIEKLGYRLTVWELVPKALTRDEMEDMVDELSYEDVPDEDLCHVIEGYKEVWGRDPPDSWYQTTDDQVGWNDYNHENDSPNWEDVTKQTDDDNVTTSAAYIDSTQAYEWTREFSQSWKMPLKSSLENFWEDSMATAVTEYLERSSFRRSYRPRKRNSRYPQCVRHGGDDSLHSSDWGETPDDSGEELETSVRIPNPSRRNMHWEAQRKQCAWHMASDDSGDDSCPLNTMLLC